jgi:hypothetical protein
LVLFLKPSDLIRRYPTIWHLCASDDPEQAWDSISREGLLSVEALADRQGISGSDREQLLSEHRPASRLVGLAVVRDTRPMAPAMLRHVLRNETPAQWRSRLNGLVFFHPGMSGSRARQPPQRHEKLWARYSNRPRLVIVLGSERVLLAGNAVLLSPINTGAVRMVSHVRGPDTIQPLEAWSPERKVAEVAIPYHVRNVLELVASVEVWLPDGSRETLMPWEAT